MTDHAPAPFLSDLPIQPDRCAYCWGPIPLDQSGESHRCLSLREALWPGEAGIYR